MDDQTEGAYSNRSSNLRKRLGREGKRKEKREKHHKAWYLRDGMTWVKRCDRAVTLLLLAGIE
jgi:hypothetical protein